MADQTQTPEAGFNYIKQAAQTQAATTQNAIDASKFMDQQQAAYSDAMLTQVAAGGAAVAKVAAQDTIDAKRDAEVAGMQKNLGTDWTDSASASSRAAAILRENTDKAYAALDVIHAQQSKTLFNDPIGHIMSQFTLPADVETYNYYARKAQLAEGDLNNIISMSSAGAVAANNMKQLTSTDLALAKSQEAATASQLQVDKLKYESAGSAIQGISVLQKLNQEQLANVFSLNSAQNDKWRLAMQAEQQSFMREARQQALDLKSKGDEDVRAMMASYNVGTQRTKGAQISDVNIFRRMMGTINSNPDMAATLVSGQMIQAKGNTSGVPVAATSGEAALLYSQSQANLTDNPVGLFLRDRLNDVRSAPGSPKNKAELAAKVTDVVQQRATRDLGTIRDGEANIYDAPPLPAMVVAAPNSFKDDQFFNKELAPILAVDKNATLNNTQILTKAVDMSKGGTADFNAAVAGVTNYYTAAVVVNVATKQYLENGLPKQNGFMASIGGSTYDLTNPADVKKYLLTAGMNPFDKLLSSGIIAANH